MGALSALSKSALIGAKHCIQQQFVHLPVCLHPTWSYAQIILMPQRLCMYTHWFSMVSAVKACVS
jgi:hypothetical protein